MIEFAVIATLLTVVVAALILPPLWLGLRPSGRSTDRKQANLAIFRDQLAELDREKAAGTLGDAEFEQSRRELQRRLLEEVETTGSATHILGASYGPSRPVAISVLIALPVLALVGYGVLGNPKAMDPARTAAPPKVTQEQIRNMVNGLAERLKANPDDLKGWAMLGRSYKAMGRNADAIQAYSKAEKLINDDPDLLAEYAEVLAISGNKGMAGKPTALVERALQLNPKHGHSLFLAGGAAMEAGENKKGIAYWEALLPQVDPGSEIDQMLRDGIDKMKAGL